jgi:hypothetical protein
MDKLEQVSEDPTLKEEMEKEVHSTSSQVGQQGDQMGRIFAYQAIVFFG